MAKPPETKELLQILGMRENDIKKFEPFSGDRSLLLLDNLEELHRIGISQDGVSLLSGTNSELTRKALHQNVEHVAVHGRRVASRTRSARRRAATPYKRQLHKIITETSL